MPTSWALNGMITSQFGDIGTEIIVFGETRTLVAFIALYQTYNIFIASDSIIITGNTTLDFKSDCFCLWKLDITIESLKTMLRLWRIWMFFGMIDEISATIKLSIMMPSVQEIMYLLGFPTP
ncbi:hypothetical protein CUMW_178020 [Citrus unshiu]|uniref:Uncharacterized protein n=1 Tax=Citrus unshiu TaxID=55188 RepID=A0A2H5PY00_CITUN|nr:hypothetical protein CUMW_178020 [Citrus unshiu]